MVGTINVCMFVCVVGGVVVEVVVVETCFVAAPPTLEHT